MTRGDNNLLFQAKKLKIIPAKFLKIVFACKLIALPAKEKYRATTLDDSVAYYLTVC